ncbi:MAG: 50S ribosomal protein L22 [Solirubrobacterales bacterium]
MAAEKKTERDQAKKPAANKKAATKTAAGSRARKPKEMATKGKGAAEASTAKQPAAKRTPARTKGATEAAAESTAKKPAAGSEGKAKAAPRRKSAAKSEPAERPVVNARARFVRVAPRKARLVADQVRGMPLEDARALLRFSTRGAAQDIRKLIESAAANAEANHDLVADELLIKDIHVDEGPTLRRYRPRALGRATRINKRTSHIVVALTPED